MMTNADIKQFKGKVKYNFWIRICANLNRFMFVCFLIFILGAVGIFAEGGTSSLGFLVIFFVVFMLFCYFYSRWVMGILQKWDKSGFDILIINSRQKYFFFDRMKMVNFSDIEEIYIKKCSDKLPSIPRMYDLINAQMRIKLKNEEEIIYYVQTFSVLYELLAYLRNLGFNVQAPLFDNNAIYKMAAHYWVVLIVILAILFPLIILFH